MSRRKLLAGLSSLTAYSIFVAFANGADLEPQTRFVWHLPGDRLGVAKDYIGDQFKSQVDTSSEDSTRGLPLILIISAIALLPQPPSRGPIQESRGHRTTASTDLARCVNRRLRVPSVCGPAAGDSPPPESALHLAGQRKFAATLPRAIQRCRA